MDEGALILGGPAGGFSNGSGVDLSDAQRPDPTKPHDISGRRLEASWKIGNGGGVGNGAATIAS